MINPIWLRSFCKLVDNQHFTRTAEQLNMTQSGVSQHIRKLENQIGVALLIRKNKKFMLTDAGKKLYDNAQHILLELANLQHMLKEDCAYSGRIKMMSPGSVGLKLYYQLLELQKKHPKLVIDYLFAPNIKIEEAIMSQDIDLGLVTALSTQENISCHPIGKEKLLLVTPSFFSSSKPHWNDLQKLGFIDHPDGKYHANMLMSKNYSEFSHIDKFKKKGFSNQIGLILLPVSMGLGFTVLPEHAVRSFDKPENIKAYELPKPVSETIYLIYHAQKPLSNRAQTIISEIKKYL